VDFRHATLAVDQAGDAVRVIAHRLVMRDEPAQQRLGPPQPPPGVRQQAVGDAQQPRQGRVAVQHRLRSPTPGVQEHGRREVFSFGPVGRAPEQVVVDGLPMTVEHPTERLPVAVDGPRPQLSVRYPSGRYGGTSIVQFHALYVSGNRPKVPAELAPL
jgi:hypothetical protein